MATHIVAGTSRHKGEYNGNPYDYCKVYLLARMDPMNKNMVGYQTIEFRAPPELWEKLKTISPMKEYDVNIETIARGKGESTQLVTGITPVAQTDKLSSSGTSQPVKPAVSGAT